MRSSSSEVPSSPQDDARQERGLDPVRVRIGISTGAVLVGNIGAPSNINYTLIGDLVNIAQHMEQLGKHVKELADVAEEVYMRLPAPNRATFWAQHEVRARDDSVKIFRLA